MKNNLLMFLISIFGILLSVSAIWYFYAIVPIKYVPLIFCLTGIIFTYLSMISLRKMEEGGWFKKKEVRE